MSALTGLRNSDNKTALHEIETANKQFTCVTDTNRTVAAFNFKRHGTDNKLSIILTPQTYSMNIEHRPPTSKGQVDLLSSLGHNNQGLRL